jgi:hypothetical protein
MLDFCYSIKPAGTVTNADSLYILYALHHS